MQILAKANKIRISPRKVNLVAGLVRGLKVEDAIGQLKFCSKIAAKPLRKLIESGVANAEHNYRLDGKNLIVKEIRVGKGFTLKRWLPRAQGRATPLRKTMSNIDLVLQEIIDSGKVDARKDKVEAPMKLGDDVKVNDEKLTKVDGVSGDGSVKDKKVQKTELAKDAKTNDKIVDQRGVGRGGHTKIEGGVKGFASKMFRRKSG